jgi:DNA topoisomerase-1
MATRSSEKRLVIVESPAKARTIAKYLGAGYQVRASVGHIRDLPERELGVDVEAGFEPRYVTIRGKGKVIQELRREAEKADVVVLATDPDREGEAIAYHVAEQLGYEAGETGAATKARFRRVRFHEITRDAVRRALEAPTALDMRKVEAQQARRILDRLVGYQVSPLLWKPIRPGLSAGRVQTVALRLIAEREAEIRAFQPEEYWSITAALEKEETRFEARLHHIDGKAFRLENEAAAARVLSEVTGLPFAVTELKRRERLKNPPAPFTTSTLQQEAAKRLGFTAQRTMRVAQQLYEGVEVGAEGSVGLITYMRTDSTRVSAEAVAPARDLIGRSFGGRYLPDSPRLWAGKQQKGAQEAHEAIRPTDALRTPDSLRNWLERDQLRLYELIWLRFVAGQMTAAAYDTTTADFALAATSGRQYLFRATGSVVKFDGFTRLYQEAREEGDHRTLDDLAPLPVLAEGDACRVLGLAPAQHFTQPPPRFTEASLVKELEKLGIGRPSTYAQIISTLTEREYVELEQKRFRTTPLGETVARVLTRVFPDVFSVSFTSEMEAELDRVEEGQLDWRRALRDFYEPFRRRLEEGERQSDVIVREAVAADAGDCPDCGRPLVVRWNRRGRFLGCSGYPECRYTRELDGNGRAEPRPTGESCPVCGGALMEREGRFGPFIACANYPRCKHTRPRTIPGLTCPKCAEGDVGEKRTRRGKPFWGCTRYPACDWSVWDEPVPAPCEVCGSRFLLRKSSRQLGPHFRCPDCRAVVADVAAAQGAAGNGAESDRGAARPARAKTSARARTPAATEAVAKKRTVKKRTAKTPAAKGLAPRPPASKTPAASPAAGTRAAGAEKATRKRAPAARPAGGRKPAGTGSQGKGSTGGRKGSPKSKGN